MRQKYLPVTLLLIAIAAVILGVRVAGNMLTHDVPSRKSPTEPVTAVERVAVRGEAGGLRSTPTERAVSQETERKDGLALLEGHCTQCHQAQWILQVQKPRTGWEMTLEQMEAMGVHLEETEKAILLDFLAGTDRP